MHEAQSSAWSRLRSEADDRGTKYLEDIKDWE